jgi:hypothetical protein
MSAVLEREAAPQRTARSPGVWAAAWSRLKDDPVGLGALGVVLAFFLLIFASAVGLTAKDWQLEKGVPYAFPRFIGERENVEAQAMLGMSIDKSRTPIDISAVDPLAPRYKEWADRVAKLSLTEPARLETLFAGGDRWGRDVLAKGDQGLADLDLRRRIRGARRDADRYAAWRAVGVLRQVGGRRPGVGLQRVHRDPDDPADLCIRGGIRPRHRDRDPDPRPDRVDRHRTGWCGPST